MKSLRNQKGFSMIELMMVVVIIGLLAGVGIPQYQKFQMRAKQSEAKSLLSGMYTAQKAFFSEWNQYYGHFDAVGYGLEGDLGYNVAFQSSIAGPPRHPRPAYRRGAPRNRLNSDTYCRSFPNYNNDRRRCSVEKSGVGAAIVGNSTVTRTNGGEFAFGARGNLDPDPTHDQWRINHNKIFTQVEDDLRN